MIGLVLPCVLIFIFGFGLSLDVNDIPIAVVMEKASPSARSILSGLNGSRYFSPRWVSSMHEAELLMHNHDVSAILRTGNDFDRLMQQGRGEIQLILHGTDSTTANLIQQFCTAAIGVSVQKELDRKGNLGRMTMSWAANLQPKIWFNEASTSTWYLVPGLIVIVMTLVGAFLTALVMAREWERGTLESLFVTPAGRAEILLSKIIPYFLMGMGGLLLCLAASRWIFEVPMRGSLLLIMLSSALYLVVALGMGLIISSVTRSQFLACQAALMISFLPTVMLSGFLFDLRSIPAIARVAGSILPATYYMEILKTLFLAGDNMSIIIKNNAALAGYAVLLLATAVRFIRKTLD